MQIYNGYFNGKYFLNDMELVVTEYNPYKHATEEHEDTPVEGRNGPVHIMKGTYPERVKIFKFITLNRISLEELREKLDDWLIDIKDNRLIYDMDSKAYRVIYAELGEITRKDFRYEFSITFTCESFLTDLEESKYNFTSKTFELFYGGDIEAEPCFKIYGSGIIQLIVNGEVFQVKNVDEYVTIDTKMQQVLDKSGLSKDNDSLGSFPTFNKGKNLITWEGDINNIEFCYLSSYR